MKASLSSPLPQNFIKVNQVGLIPAHRGYEYQDLLVACRLVDVLLREIVEAQCDIKLVDNDRFDDLTTTDVDGRRERSQFKHTDDDDRPLSLATFIGDTRGLRLDVLMCSMLADRRGPGSLSTDTTFRVILRDQTPSDPKLTAVLKACDLGPYIPGFETTRLRFDAQALWQQKDANADGAPFAMLFDGNGPLTFCDLVWCCERLIVECGAPRASLDLTSPSVAERLLLNRVSTDIGAGVFPNENRSVVDVATAMVSAARAARQQLLNLTPEELLRRTQLRSDFGAVARSHPVEPRIEVRRHPTVQRIGGVAGHKAVDGGCIIIEGPPGHGKSWACQQVLETLRADEWLVAEHYCYLGDADGERQERVLLESIFGSLIGRLADEDYRLVQEQRPRFAADEDTLVACLHRSRKLAPDRPVALVIDGVDHITRIRSRASSFDPSRSLSETFASLDIPAGTIVIILSQSGSHLEPLVEAGATIVHLEGLTDDEIATLAERIGVVAPKPDAGSDADATWRIVDNELAAAFLSALVDRSSGNALYATYLCRETLRAIESHADPAGIVLGLPPFDGTLRAYYDHLYSSLGHEAGWVADVIAMVDFPISKGELKEIRPDAAHRVDTALNQLRPVLVERATQGGFRVYHESFARYLRTPFQKDPKAEAALLGKITDWLEQKGLFSDSRAFRSLLSLLAESGKDSRVVALVDVQFVAQAVAGCFPASTINRNLATAIGAAARQGSWPLVIRYVELSRAAEWFQWERYDTTLVSYADVPAKLLGADVVAERLLENNRLVVSAREGLQMCAALDSLGAIPPWRAYMEGYLREAKKDHTSYGEESERAVSLAQLRGRLRLATENTTDADDGLSAPIDWDTVAGWIQSRDLKAEGFVRVVLETQGWEGLRCLAQRLKEPARACLEIADECSTRTDVPASFGSPRRWAIAAVAHGLPPGTAVQALAHGIDPAESTPVEIALDRLIELTTQVLNPSNLFEERTDCVGQWLDLCIIAARETPIVLAAAEALLAGEGWYRCWLRFTVNLARAHAAGSNQGQLTVEAMGLLTGDLRPFIGDPRSCDLYYLHGLIAQTIRQAMALLDDAQWSQGLEILKCVSHAISTTTRGELGGPIPADLLLSIAVEQTSPTRYPVVEKLIDDEIRHGSVGRFYSDLAEYRLLRARHAIASHELTDAELHWNEACLFLTGYGYRRDRTLFELLDPLPSLVGIDPKSARVRISQVQSLCHRVPLHTDGKETRHSRSTWWNIFAGADPVALVHLVAQKLLSECNDPNQILHGALEEVWRIWHSDIDPIVAGSLRLSLDLSLDPSDADHLQSLSKVDSTAARRLLIWLLARLDERPVSYSVTNSDELVQRDNQRLHELNEIAKSADVPCVFGLQDIKAVDDNSEIAFDPGESLTEKSQPEESMGFSPSFPPGMPGLVRAIRTLRALKTETSGQWSSEQIANVIGYRLVDLHADGRSEEAHSALRSLADAHGFGVRTSILRPIAEGLERHGATQLAAIAYALAWTCTRGQGGWLTFGGETEIDSLRRATALDAAATNTVVASEIERTVETSRYGTNGITQGVIYALAVGALLQPSKTVAFDSWDEAFDVIRVRTPRVHDSDDPDIVYRSTANDCGEPSPGDLEAAILLAAIVGIADASREKKRRAFLATQFLLEERPLVCARVLPIVLKELSDPAVLSWLLAILESCGPQATATIDACQEVLRQLTTREQLTVRALARRLITADPPPLMPAASPHAALMRDSSSKLWLPLDPQGADDGRQRNVQILNLVAGTRIEEAESMLPHFGRAVRIVVSDRLNNESLERRIKRQLDAFGDRSTRRWPDAFLAHVQVIEEVMQSLACGGRSVLWHSGAISADPVKWEDELASSMLNNPAMPLMLESLRQPRPNLPPPPSIDSVVWKQVRRFMRGGRAEKIQAAGQQDDCVWASLSSFPNALLATNPSGPHKGWYWLGTYEKRAIKVQDFTHDRDLYALRYRIAEVHDPDSPLPSAPPVTKGDLRIWFELLSAMDGKAFASGQPLLGLDNHLPVLRDGAAALGGPSGLLVPSAQLIVALGLVPGEKCSWKDSKGTGISLITWRAEYEVSEYHMPWPRISGCGVLIRPDLFAKLTTIVGEQRLVVRDFVVGDSEVIKVAT